MCLTLYDVRWVQPITLLQSTNVRIYVYNNYIYIPGGGAVNAHPRKFVNIFYEMWMGVGDNKAANLETSSTIEQHVKHYV